MTFQRALDLDLDPYFIKLATLFLLVISVPPSSLNDVKFQIREFFHRIVSCLLRTWIQVIPPPTTCPKTTRFHCCWLKDRLCLSWTFQFDMSKDLD